MKFDYMYQQTMKAVSMPDTLKEKAFIHKQRRSTRSMVSLLIAVVLLVALTTTAIAYREEVINLMFGNSVAKQQEFEESYVSVSDRTIVEPETGAEHTVTLYQLGTTADGPNREIVNRIVPDIDWTWADLESISAEMDLENMTAKEYLEALPALAYFTNTEEFHQATLFTVNEPSYLPEGWDLSGCEIWLYKDGSYSYDVGLYYRLRNNAGYPLIFLAQYYAGPEAYFDIAAVESFEYEGVTNTVRYESVLVGSEEALLKVCQYDYDVADYGQSSVQLRWIKDGIAYVLAMDDLSDPEGNYELLETIGIESMIEILIAIAESI